MTVAIQSGHSPQLGGALMAKVKSEFGPARAAVSDIPPQNTIKQLERLDRPARTKTERQHWEQVGEMFRALARFAPKGSQARRAMAKNVEIAFQNAGYNGRSEKLAEAARRAKRYN